MNTQINSDFLIGYNKYSDEKSFIYLYDFLEYAEVYRRQPKDNREAEIMVEGNFSDSDDKNIAFKLSFDIAQLKSCRYIEDKKKQYALISDDFEQFFKRTGILSFRRELVLSFFSVGQYPTTTRNRHAKNIIRNLLLNKVIAESESEKTSRQRRVYELKSNDSDGYFFLMKDNGFSVVNYYKWYCDSDGIPRKKIVGTSKVNCFPVDENGDSVEDYDLSSLKQTLPVSKQGLDSFGSKSIAFEQRRYTRKCFKVLA